DRTLRVVLWYPTRDASGDSALYAGLLPAPGAFAGAAPVDDAGPLPVVVFSHGNTSFAEQSYFLTEHLASHGFLVAAVDHTGNTFSAGGGVPVEIFHWRPGDLTALLDHLEGLPAAHALGDLVGA